MKKKISVLFLTLMMVVGLLPLSSINVSAQESELIINDSEVGQELHQFNYQGNWGTSEGYPDRFYGGDEHWFNFQRYTQGDPLPSYEIKFKGTGIELYGEKQPQLGIYNIYLDNEKIDTVDAYSAQRVASGKIYSKTGIEYGEHTLKVELSNTKNSSSSACDGEVDYAKVLGVQEEQTDNFVSKIEDSDVTSADDLFKFKYTGAWTAGTGSSGFSNGDEHYAHAGDYFEITFIGTKVEIYATLDRGHGVYDVFIDGKAAGTADGTTTGGRVNQQLIYGSEELSDGQHTIKVMLPEGASGAIQVDFAKVYHGPIAPTGISLSETAIRLESGMTKQITAKVLPGIATNKDIVWQSEDENVATVDENGLIRTVGNKEAETTITATVKGTDVSAAVAVKVVPAVEYLSATVGNVNALNTQEDYNDLIAAYEDSWKDVAWKGDVLNSKIVTCTRKAVHNAKITASDFVNGSAVISSDNVEIKWLKEINANIGRGNSSAPVKPFPDVIYKGGSLDIEANKVQQAWININVPKDVQPGVYKGTVTVTADELETPYVFNYEFEVLNLVQPETSEVGTEIQVWQHPFSVANHYLGLGSKPSGGISNELANDFYFTEKHFNLMRASMEEYRDLGGRDVVANIVEEAWNHQSYYNDPSMVKWTKKADGTFEFDYTWYDAWINFQVECGVLDPENGIGQIKCYSIVPWNNQIAYYDEATGQTVKKSYRPGSADWKEIWGIFLTDFMEHSKAKGWFEITYISMDERGLDQLEPAVEMIESITDVEGNHFKISSALNYAAPEYYDFTDRINDISINQGNAANVKQMQALSQHRQERGLTTTIYTCTGDYPSSYTISDPADNYWTMWYSMTTQTDGFMRWAWDNYVYNMHENISYRYWEPGDGWFIYPIEKEELDENFNASFYSTPRYEMLKKGIRDVNKAKYLMEQSEELKEKVNELTGSIKTPNGKGSYGSKVPASEADRQLVYTEVNRMKEGIIDLSRELLNTTPETVNKTALEAAVTTAKALKEQGALDNVVPVVVAEFNVALAEAQTILADPNVDQATVDASFFRLAKAIQMVDFVKGDKTELAKLIEEYSKLKEENYTTDSWKVFKDALDAAIVVNEDENALEYEVQEALNNLKDGYAQLVVVADKTALQAMVDKVNGLDSKLYTEASWAKLANPMKTAQAVLDNPNATQAEVNAAYEALVRAYLELRLIPDKSLLEDLINKANGLNVANYTKASYGVLKDALEDAKAVFNDPNATQTEVDNAKDVLAKAMANLQTVKAPVNNGDTTVSVKTGDESLVGMFAGIALLSVAGYALLRRKED
ncbi:MAG: FIVAR domain-containing protein [[Clostridium] spiroforme]|uniref:FIVAR domain-containing protein n=1 Tax=Thomasclavelia spiroformis TaxID=29348 RepID=A0A943ELL0_9FIRM|nr:glycoside hydrolase domain-containing protein [Thomasclavelia spiroformis]MBS5588942.1 FIVAR domain-containing protein [Thomasclavelia spiroformis]